MKNKFFKYTLLGCALIALFSSCKKDSFDGKETKQSGKTFVYITEAGGDPYVQFFDVFSDIKPVVLFTVRRDAANTADLQKAITVTLVAQPDSTTALGLTPFTSDLYTLPTAADLSSGGLYASSNGITVSSDGKTITVNFAPGEFNKNIIYKVDGSKLDLTQTYGAVYSITNLGGFTGKVGLTAVGAGIAVKNAYDGVYAYTGELNRFLADGSPDAGSALGGTIPAGKSIQLLTNGPTSDAFNYLLWADGTTQVGGIAGIQVSVDPATNQVTVTSSNASLKNLPGQDNYYDPATKTFHLNFGWYTGAVGASSSRQAHITLAYQGPR